MNHIKHIKLASSKHDIIKYIKCLDMDTIRDIINILSDNYFNKTSLVPDYIYDIIIDYAKQIDKDLQETVGYLPSKNIVKLPVYLGSENKTYQTDNKLFNWLEKYGTDKLVLSAKADGVSVLLDYTNKRAFTRGNGYYGTDITPVAIEMNLFNITTTELSLVRGEIVALKPLKRQYASGLLNRKQVDTTALNQLLFLAYEIISPRFDQETQFIKLKLLGINIVCYETISKNKLTYNYLQKLLVRYKTKFTYDVDGVIIRNNKRNDYYTSGNPIYSISYKYNFDYMDAKIRNIKWNITKNKLLVPVAILDPIRLGGVKVSKVSCYNAKYVLKHKLGISSIVRIVRSGSVLVNISEVIKSTTPKLPFCEYTYEDPNFIYIGERKDPLCKRIKYFFNYLGYKNIRLSTIELLVRRFGIDDILDLFYIDPNMLQAEERMYRIIIDTINCIRKFKIPTNHILPSLSLPCISTSRANKILECFGESLFTDNIKRDYTVVHGISIKLSDKINEEFMVNFECINKLYKL